MTTWTSLSDRLRRRHREIYIIVAPPRTASTALSRVIWEHSSVGYYCHEPFDVVYHEDGQLDQVRASLESPVGQPDVLPESVGRPSGLVVKEMSFQVGAHFGLLKSLTRRPLIFLLRDPRLNISSRMRQREKGGQNPLFAQVETGWTALSSQVLECRNAGVPYVVLDSTDLRNQPSMVVSRLFDRLSLDFSLDVLSWQPLSATALGSLGTQQAHWYRRVLRSRSIEPATEIPPDLEWFPVRDGFRSHVRECLEIYRKLLSDDRMIRPEGAG